MASKINIKRIIKYSLYFILFAAGIYSCIALNITIFFFTVGLPQIRYVLIISACIIALQSIIETFIYMTNILRHKNYLQTSFIINYKIWMTIIIFLNLISIIVFICVFIQNGIPKYYSWRETLIFIPQAISICFLICQSIRFAKFLMQKDNRK